jgi:hypothetical protein
MKNSKNIAILNDFIHYCIAHPDERFWQALRNWSEFKFIYANKDTRMNDAGEDTYYFEGKDK